jgi:hypothetical protein
MLLPHRRLKGPDDRRITVALFARLLRAAAVPARGIG